MTIPDQLHLTLLHLDPRRARDPYDVHRIINTAFPATDQHDPAFRARHGILWAEQPGRRDAVTVVVQSITAPEWPDRSADYIVPPQTRIVPAHLPGITEGAPLRFLLYTSPQRSVPAAAQIPGQRRPRGRKEPLLTDTERRAWLHRQGERHGFSIDDTALQIVDHGTLRSRRKPIAWRTVLFRGILTPTDLDRFTRARLDGIGPGKAWGLGLLRLA
ncbi:MAG TPA: type I-E CRISPR-associated protein Cas6/Cse3/CasE [Actinobacteria bacterium]|nr:type I-E CRISPR-associated protein Cas6/Cse3/CasE [Actinomycetota bacterium]